jgi:TPR repeat protein
MYQLGRMYQKGWGTAVDLAESYRWFRAAADVGDNRAYAKVAKALLFGQGVKREPAEAAQWHLRAAGAGDVESMLHTARNRRNGHNGIPKDVEAALRWYQRAADAGNTQAMRELAMLHRSGQLGARDSEEALRWFKLAADAGEPNSLVHYGDVLSADKRDGAAAQRWYSKALKRLGPEPKNPSVAHQLESRLASLDLGWPGVEANEARALERFRQLAEQKNRQGLLGLAWFHENGRAGAAHDLKQALACYARLLDARSGQNELLLVGTLKVDSLGFRDDQPSTVDSTGGDDVSGFLRKGDTIHSLDGRRVEAAEVQDLLESKAAGAWVLIDVRRPIPPIPLELARKEAPQQVATVERQIARTPSDRGRWERHLDVLLRRQTVQVTILARIVP